MKNLARIGRLHAVCLSLVAMVPAGCATMGGTTGVSSYVASPQLLGSGGLVEVVKATGYLAYHAPTAADVPNMRYLRRVRGEVCQDALHLPLHLVGGHSNAALSWAQTLDLAWGNAAVAQAMADALAGAPPGAALYDLAFDLHRTSLFGLFYRRQCLVVGGSLAVPMGPATGVAPPLAPAAHAIDPNGPSIAPHNPAPLPALVPPPSRSLGTVAPLREAHPTQHNEHKGGHDGRKKSGRGGRGSSEHKGHSSGRDAKATHGRGHHAKPQRGHTGRSGHASDWANRR